MRPDTVGDRNVCLLLGLPNLLSLGMYIDVGSSTLITKLSGSLCLSSFSNNSSMGAGAKSKHTISLNCVVILSIRQEIACGRRW